MPARGGESQRLVRETMIAAGGYWRPLAAVARLLEELGELLELLEDGPAPELGDELADLWIITTALADQFLAEVPEPGAETVDESETSSAGLIVAAGPIARVVNHYDGPKVPREGVPMPSLKGSIAEFHRVLGGLAATLGIDLADAVRSKLVAIHRRGDIERFARGGFDPSTAPVLARLADRAVPGLAGEPSAQGRRGTDSSAPGLPARLWGAPELSAEAPPQEWAATISGSLEVFAKAARPEGLEGYVIELPAGAGRLGTLVVALDPSASHGEMQAFSFAGTSLLADPLSAGPRSIALVRLAP